MLYARPLWLMVDRLTFAFALLPPSIFLIYFALFLKIDFEFEPSTTFMVTVATFFYYVALFHWLARVNLP